LREQLTRTTGDHTTGTAGTALPHITSESTRTAEFGSAATTVPNGTDQANAQSTTNNPFDSFPANDTVFASHVPYANSNAGNSANANVNIFGGDQNNGPTGSMQDDPFDFSGMGGGAGAGAGAGPGAGAGGLVDNPFDTFLLHPLGEMTTDDWNRAVASVFGPGQLGGDFSF
jgi:hypothetical protein